MVRRHEFIHRINFILRKKFEKILPEEATLDEMIDIAKKIDIFEED